MLKFAVVFIMLVLMFAPLPANQLWLREALNSGHSLFFFFLSLYFYRIVCSSVRTSNVFLISIIVFSAGILLGIAIEVVQIFLQRDASLSDIKSDAVGLLAGLVLVFALEAKKVGRRALEYLFKMVFVAMLFIVFMPLLQLSWHYVKRNNAFPVVLDLDSDWSGSFVSFRHARMLESKGLEQNDELSLIQFDSALYPGLSVKEPVPDWSEYRRLRFSVVSHYDKSVEMVLRIHDKSHNQAFEDRFNQRLIIYPGRNEYTIEMESISGGSSTRKINLMEIAGIILFLSGQNKPVQLFMSDIYLE